MHGIEIVARCKGHLRGLREGADGGGRPRGQLQPRGLPGRALGKGAGALLQFGRDAAHGLLHIGQMHARRGAAGGQRGLVGQQLLFKADLSNFTLKRSKFAAHKKYLT